VYWGPKKKEGRKKKERAVNYYATEGKKVVLGGSTGGKEKE